MYGSILVDFLDVSGSGNNGIRTFNGNIYSTGSGNITTNTGNISTTTGTITGGALSCTTITSNNNTISAGTSSVSGGSILSSVFNSNGIGIVLDIGANQTTGVLSIGNNASRTGAINIGTLTTGAHAINIGNSTSTQTININRPWNTVSINTSNNNISAGTGSIESTTFISPSVEAVLNLGPNQTTGALSIGNNINRTGDINISTITSGAHAINIGDSATTQTININRPIRMSGILYTSGQEIGYSQNNSITFFSGTGNPPLPGTVMNTPITSINLIHNANYLIKYSLTISPQANFNVTKLQYGLYASGFITSCSNNHSVHSGTTAIVTTRFLTTDTYSYSGSGFFRYNSSISFSFSYFMDFLATAPLIVTNTDLIRIS